MMRAAVLLLVTLAVAPAWADPPTEATLRKEVEGVARRYANARASLRAVCGKCGGKGRYAEWTRGGQRIADCPVCDRKGWVIDRKDWRAVYYDLKSPAYRLWEGAQKAAEDAYRKALKASEPPATYASSKIAALALVDPSHAVTRLTFDGRLEEVVRWVKVEGKWWLWDAQTDGEWPAPPPVEEPTGDPLAPDELGRLSMAIGGIATRHHDLYEGRKVVAGLLLTLDLRPVGAGVALDGLALEDFRRLGKAIWVDPAAAWSSITWTLRARHRDRFGAVEQQPYLRARISREDFDRIRWENLSPEEAMALFTPQRMSREGWTLWRQDD